MNAIRAEEERLLEEVHEESAAVLKKLKNVTLLTMPDPWDIETIKPKLVFYHRNRPDIQATFDSNPREVALALLNGGFLDSARLVLITHGFHNNFDTDWLHSYKDDILNRTAANKGQEHTVAILGWGGGADLLVFRYRQAASNVMTVGHWLANYTRAISEVKRGLLIYGIGHSLGAHVMGVAGRESKALSRITGLDPAGPCFEKVANSPTLNPGDASFVDVIHTDGYDSKLDPSEWFFPVNHYGSLIPIGHLDFYPNFGYHQPGAGTFTVAGSHLRALELFGWSITNPGRFLTADVLAEKPDFDEPVEKFIAGQYQVEMGFYADRSHLPPANASTLFYLKTNSQTPWV